ncbi:hypothetical protein NFI96_002527, partial [Prochilodus magdalenae]
HLPVILAQIQCGQNLGLSQPLYEFVHLGKGMGLFPNERCFPHVKTDDTLVVPCENCHCAQNSRGWQFSRVYPVWKGKVKEGPMACGVPVKSEPMIKVGDSKSYVIGSYVEHRLERKTIRTVAIVLRSEQVEYYCVLCCDGREFSVAASCDIHSDHFGFEYGAADITCPVPETCTTPAHVAITYRTHEGNGSLWNIQSNQPVMNQQPRRGNFPHTFTVCISAMFDYSNVLGLVQAMEMFKILGVQKVAIYKTSCDSDIQKILDYYVRQDFVDIIPWTVTSYINVSSGWIKSLSPGELHYYGQIPALTDCLYRYMYESQYVALQDLDELILPITGENWATLIHQLEMKYPHHAGFMFENNVFPIYVSSHQKPEYTPELWNNITGENILPHVYRIPQNIPEKYSNFKVIVNPRLVFRPTVHGLLQSTGGAVWVDPNIARMYHIKAVSGQKRSKSCSGAAAED